MSDASTTSFERVLVGEQTRLAVKSATRWVPSVAWLGILVVLRLVADEPGVHAVLPISAANAVYSVAVTVAKRFMRHPLRTLYLIPFVDVPFVGAVALVWARAPGESVDWVYAVALAVFGVFITVAAKFLDKRVLCMTAASAAVVASALFAYSGQSPLHIAVALWLVGYLGFMGWGVMRHSVTLIRRTWDLAQARVKEAEDRTREVTQLNEELRRQVAERSRELTEALARSEGHVAPAALNVGEVFDRRYRVARPLGRGGMGAVFEVERTRDGRRLALKVVTAALSARQAARFAREAEIGARLQHDNLVSIVDVGIAAGAAPFLVMELVEGGSLEDQRAHFGNAAWARPILRQIASGLAALHAAHIVHRDLKPGNVLLLAGADGAAPVAKISDFGISRFGAIDDSDSVDAEGATMTAVQFSPGAQGLTQPGAIMGTPHYMPPEAWRGPASAASADVFSFGVLAHEALSGQSPFPIPAFLLARAGHSIPAPARLDGLDARVASLVLACLHADPAARPRAKEIAEAMC